MKDLLRNPQPSFGEFIFAIFVVSALAVGIGYVDGVIFDTYVKPLMINGVGSEVGQPYQSIMLGAIIWIALGLAAFRVVAGRLAGAKLKPILFFTGGLWFLSTLVFHNTGWTDYFYYTLRKIPIPTDLPWLNEMGLFQWVRLATGNENVNTNDLYIGMAVGVVVLLILWGISTHHYRRGTLRKMGIV